MMKTQVIKILQLDPQTGHVYRIFTSHVPVNQVNARLDHIKLAYNIKNTRVLVDGVHHPEFA